MSVFMCSPGIKIYVSTQKNGIIDVSDDVTQGTMVRRSDGVSSFSFTLQNPFRKYSGIFTPNDRIIVMMKRISWLRTFTGYLNAVPLVTAWPSSVQITASCSLKRLQYWFWDPGLYASQNMVASALAVAKNPDDGGVSNAVLAILQNVVGWPASKVHIAGIPQGWTTWAWKIAKAVKDDTANADALAQQFYATLGAGGVVGGVTGGGVTVPSGALKPGTYGSQQLNASQCSLAVLIYNVCVQLGGTTRDAVVGIMTAYQESKLANLPNGTGSSLGLFQQTTSWGTAPQRLNTTWATRAFYKVLLAMGNRDSMTLDQEAQAVQRSAFPKAYAQWQTMAVQIVNILSNGQGASSLANSPGFDQLAGTGKAGKGNAAQLLGVALGLVQSHQIPYQEGGDSAPNVPVPVQLDCSSFVQWVMYHTVGSSSACPRTSQEQSAWCQSSGQIVSADQGMNTPGALMFKGQPGAAGHVEVSCGTGQHTVGAHSTGTYAGVVQSAGYWDCAGLPPGIDYSAYNGKAPVYKQVPPAGALSSGANIPVSAQGLQTSPASAEPWYNPNDPFDKLFGTNPWFPGFDAEAYSVSQVFSGPRALLNDQPLLPYIKNLLGSAMRSYSSAPNGDFVAWFPDYYGIWGTAAIMRVEPIELQDFTVYWDDTSLVTHQYTIAPPAQQINLGSGAAAGAGISIPSTGQTLPLDVILAMSTTGIASIDIPAIMYALFGLEPSKAQAQQFIDYIYNRFGARPDLQQLPGVVGPQGEFFSALFLFMRSWAYQYNSDIPLTFMPELWPGMLIQIPAFGFQAYVTTVTHSFQLGEGGFFKTSVNVAAPARLPGSGNDSGGQLIGLPVAGGLTSGTNLPLPGTGGA